MAFVFVPAVAAMAPLDSPINIPAMTGLGHYNPQIIVRNLVDNAVVPPAQPVPTLAGEKWARSAGARKCPPRRGGPTS